MFCDVIASTPGDVLCWLLHQLLEMFSCVELIADCLSSLYQDSDWVDYDEQASQSVGIYNIEHKFVVVK